MPPDVPIIEPLRLRGPKDTIESLKKERLLAMTIKARDEFLEDIDLVVKERVGFNIGKGEHGMMKRYLVKWEGQEIECIPEDVVFHDWQTWPMKIIMNRFITGRPNPI